MVSAVLVFRPVSIIRAHLSILEFRLFRRPSAVCVQQRGKKQRKTKWVIVPVRAVIDSPTRHVVTRPARELHSARFLSAGNNGNGIEWVYDGGQSNSDVTPGLRGILAHLPRYRLARSDAVTRAPPPPLFSLPACARAATVDRDLVYVSIVNEATTTVNATRQQHSVYLYFMLFVLSPLPPTISTRRGAISLGVAYVMVLILNQK